MGAVLLAQLSKLDMKSRTARGRIQLDLEIQEVHDFYIFLDFRHQRPHLSGSFWPTYWVRRVHASGQAGRGAQMTRSSRRGRVLSCPAASLDRGSPDRKSVV